MSRPLTSIIANPTNLELREKLLLQLKGIGFCRRSGYSPGSVSLSGVPSNAYSLVISVVAGGELGTATFRVSLDGGVTWGGTVQVPATGVRAILNDGVIGTVNTGLTAVFTAAPAGLGASFIAGDTFSFSTRTPAIDTTSWQPGSTPLTMVENDAEALAELYALISEIAAGGFTTLAKGPWLDLLAENFFRLERLPAVTAMGLVTFTNANGTAQNIAAGQLWVKSSSGARFQTVSAFTIPAGGAAQVAVRAERPGKDHNAAVGTVVTMVTSLPGVSVANPAASGFDWLTTQGADRESDASLASRCMARWPSLSGGGHAGAAAPSDVWVSWVKAADPSVTRVQVRASPTVPGRVDVTLAGASGPAGPGAVAAVSDYVQPRLPIGTTALVQTAAAHPYVIIAVVMVLPGRQGQVARECAKALEEINAASVIGGTIYTSAIIDALHMDGVRNVVLVHPVVDVVIEAGRVGVLTQQLSFVTV